MRCILTVLTPQSSALVNSIKFYDQCVNRVDHALNIKSAGYMETALTCLAFYVIFDKPLNAITNLGLSFPATVMLRSAAVIGISKIFNKAMLFLHHLTKEAMQEIVQDSRQNPKQAVLLQSKELAEILQDYPQYIPTFLYGLFEMFSAREVMSWRYNRNLLQDLSTLAKTHSIEHIVVGSESDFTNRLVKLKDKTIDLLLIEAHGNPTKISFGPDFVIDEDSAAHMQKIAEKMKGMGSQIILLSCSTAKGDFNIARTLALFCPNTIVTGPIDDAALGPKALRDDLSPAFIKKCTHYGVTRKQILHSRTVKPAEPLAKKISSRAKTFWNRIQECLRSFLSFLSRLFRFSR